ncbi:unnamed protein product [Lasius platythorax]|uniref:Uncharacterized protein n=1 Tax=Lasius platythorax TaxID=488582 RepID=A0AAV2NQU8_9HYME
MVVFLSSRGYDLAARGEFMRKSGAGVIPEPREVNYSTSGRAGGRQLPTKEYEQSSLMKIIRAGDRVRQWREKLGRIPRGGNEKLDNVSRSSRANASGQFATNQNAKHYRIATVRNFWGISDDDDATGAKKQPQVRF